MGGASVQTAVIGNAGGNARGMNMVSVTEVNRTLVAAPPERAFQALSAAYATLNIPVTDINQQARTLGNNAFRTRRRIGDVPTMRALDCGGDSGMPNAETYQLTLTIQSTGGASFSPRSWAPGAMRPRPPRATSVAPPSGPSKSASASWSRRR
jgi:hypothetical protein